MKLQTYIKVVTVAGLMILTAAAAVADTVTIPKGTDVPLVFDQAVSSKTAKKGDKITLHVESDVVVGTQIVFARGTSVTGIITNVQHRKNFGVNANLKLAFNPVATILGASIDIGPRSKGKSTGSRTDHAAVIAGGGALLLGPVGLVGGYFVVGKQVEIKPGDKIQTEVVRETSIVK